MTNNNSGRKSVTSEGVAAESPAENSELLKIVSKEIELAIQNTYSMRMKVVFTSWIGPFILLGAIVVANKGPVSITYDTKTLFSGIFALLAYFSLAAIFGRYERGNWRRCDRLRELAIDLTNRPDLKDRLLDNRYEKNVLLYYAILSTTVAVIFICCLSFVTTPYSALDGAIITETK